VIKGSSISLRPVAESDLEELHRELLDLESRGPWYPLPRTSFIKFRAAFDESGFWSADEGIFLIVDEQGRTIGTADWEHLNGSVSDVEAAYHIFDRRDWGKGFATQAVDLLTGWLFDSQPINRVQLVIHVDNVGSRRVAEKSGFTKEATAREAWYHKGAWHDVDIYVMTRVESEGRLNVRRA
jgi:RimJ/RimL family protein N-acetyltransferase